MDITEVSQRSGVPASTLRFYEEKKLIASIGRRGLRRLFDPGVLERLALIALGRARQVLARRDRADACRWRTAAHRPAKAGGKSRGTGQDDPGTQRYA
jgi:DNA-binding transcriptional MerR regulator